MNKPCCQFCLVGVESKFILGENAPWTDICRDPSCKCHLPKEKCNGVHCKCMNFGKQCPNRHYADCTEHNPELRMPTKQTPAPEKKWERRYSELLLSFLTQQLAWEKAKNEEQDILRGSPVLQEIAEKKYNELKSFIASILEEKAVEVEIQNLDIIVIPKGRDTIGYGEGYKDGRNEAAAILRR